MFQPQPTMSQSTNISFQLNKVNSDYFNNHFPVFTGLRGLTSLKNEGSILLTAVLLAAVILNNDLTALILEPGPAQDFRLLKGVFFLPPLHMPTELNSKLN